MTDSHHEFFRLFLESSFTANFRNYDERMFSGRANYHRDPARAVRKPAHPDGNVKYPTILTGASAAFIPTPPETRAILPLEIEPPFVIVYKRTKVLRRLRLRSLTHPARRFVAPARRLVVLLLPSVSRFACCVMTSPFPQGNRTSKPLFIWPKFLKLCC